MRSGRACLLVMPDTLRVVSLDRCPYSDGGLPAEAYRWSPRSSDPPFPMPRPRAVGRSRIGGPPLPELGKQPPIRRSGRRQAVRAILGLEQVVDCLTGTTLTRGHQVGVIPQGETRVRMSEVLGQGLDALARVQ